MPSGVGWRSGPFRYLSNRRTFGNLSGPIPAFCAIRGTLGCLACDGGRGGRSQYLIYRTSLVMPSGIYAPFSLLKVTFCDASSSTQTQVLKVVFWDALGKHPVSGARGAVW